MKRGLLTILGFVGFAAAAPAVFAAHGTLLSKDRDPWINASVDRLVSAGWANALGKPVQDMNNLEVAEFTKEAGDMIVAQAMPLLPPPGLSTPEVPMPPPAGFPMPGLANSPSPSATADMKRLLEEFQEEVTAMGADLPQIEDRIYTLEHHNEAFTLLQDKYLKRTGTTLSGYSRGYFNTFRGFGANAPYGPMDYNDDIFAEMDLKSVPVPSILFDARIRFWTTIGLYYQDPFAKNGGQPFDIRWLSLSSVNPYVNITAGDFLQHYTPLTLWNYEVPVYTLTEPTSYYRTRKNVEELVSMNYGTDWRLRGFQAYSSIDAPKNPYFDSFKIQAMGGPLDQADLSHFGSYYAGSQASLHFFEDNLEMRASGLMLWDDAGTADATLVTNTPKQYQVGSFSGRFNIPLGSKDISLSGTGESAGSSYQDNLNDTQSLFQEWAQMFTGSINVKGVHLTAKYLNIGPYFYSPGAQTNRYTPALGQPGYLSDSHFWSENFLVGYLNNFPFQGIQGTGRPTYAPYDRLSENVLPYGDSTPNREGFVFGLSGEIGKNGWLKPQASWIPNSDGLRMQEIQPDYVVNGAGNQAVAVDSTTNTAGARTFSGFEGALTLDLAKAFDLEDKTYQISGDYKDQTTDLTGLAGGTFEVKTIILGADFTIPAKGFDTVVLSAAFKQTQSTGNEFVLGNVGNPSTLASYSFYMDNSKLGTYVYAPLNLTKTSWAFGFLYPFSKTIQFHGDVFLDQITSSDFPLYDNRDLIWRLNYEAWF